MSTPADLLDLLDARTGIVCAVGAGGKKTTLRRLFAAHPGRAALTATVQTAQYDAALAGEHVIETADALPGRMTATAATHIAYATPSDKPHRHAGVPAAVVERLHERCAFDVTYVKADGARMRWIKAPADHEPVLPEACRTIIAVVSARVLGEPLTERVAHRMERLCEITEARAEQVLTPLHIARLLASPQGLLKDAGLRRVVPVINMVDDEPRARLAAEAARYALDLTDRFDRVVLASMRRPGSPVVAVIQR